ncbi:MAG: PQQ-binding-like beta-propeller repeat protein [Prolixibacteraceae bacterium]
MRTIQFLFLFFIVISCTQKQEIAQWRGENRDGLFAEKDLLKVWPENGPEQLWAFEEAGDGYGSVTVTKDKILLNGMLDSISYLMALNLKGELLWKAPNGTGYVGEGFTASFPGSRSTPTVIGDLVYVSSGKGRIACYSVTNGQEKWAVDLLKDLNGVEPDFGYGESLLVDENKVFCYPGGKDNNMVALDRFSGEIIWTSPALLDTATHCSPIVVNLPARKVLVNFSTRNLMGLDAETGELLWSHKQELRKYSEQSLTPIYRDGALYYVAGDGNGAVKMELSDDGSSFKEIWRNYIDRNSMNGFLIIGEKLYSTSKKSELNVLDLSSGEKTDSLKIRDGAIIAADDMIYCYSDNGEVALIDYSKSPLQIVGQLKIDLGSKHHFARPVIKNGVLYIRHGNALMAYSLKAK